MPGSDQDHLNEGLQVCAGPAFYYAITAYACVCGPTGARCGGRRGTSGCSGALPFGGAVAMTWVFVQSAIDMFAPDYGKPTSARSVVCL